MQRNVRTRKFTVNVRKNRAQHGKMQLIATNPVLFNVVVERLNRDSVIHKRLGRLLGGGKPEEGQAWALPKSYLY